MKKVLPFLMDYGMILIGVLVFICCSLFVPNFATGQNLIGVGESAVSVGFVACTMMLCLAAGDFDLSVGSVLALGGVVTLMVGNASGSLGIGILAGLGAGALIGLVNGVFIAKVGINALIATLATMQISRGLTQILAEGSVVSPKFQGLDGLTKQVMGVPVSVWLMLVMFIVFGFILNRTVFGRNTLAIGGNSEAAHLAGIPVARTKIFIFMLSGLVASFAGILASSRIAMASNNAGDKLELQAISACVLGGVSLAGGQATMGGVVVGVFILGMIDNAMRLQNVPTFWQLVVTGVVLLFAVTIDRLKVKAIKT